MENFTIGVSLQSGQGQTLSKANFSPSSVSSSKTSSPSSETSLSSSKTSSKASFSSTSSLITSKTSSSSSGTFRTHSSSSPSPDAVTYAVTTLSSSPSENSSILTFPVASNASNWNSSTPYNFPMESATLKVEKGFPAGGIAGIVVGGFVFLVIMIIVVVCLCRTCRRSEKYGNCFKSKVNNRQSYEVNELPSKASSVKKVFNEFSDSFSRRGETRIDEVVPSPRTNDEEVPRCSDPTPDQSEVSPPPVPRRDATTKRDNGDPQQSPQPYSTASYVSPSVAAFDPTSENGSGELESFPDELPPPPPRDSFLVLDS